MIVRVKSSTSVSPSGKKNFSKPIDKPHKMWYNEYVIKGRTPYKPERN
jgi:hypothetical protein